MKKQIIFGPGKSTIGPHPTLIPGPHPSTKSHKKKNKSEERDKKIDKLMSTDTHYLLIIDESGSMKKVKQQTLDGLNEQIQTIKALEKQYPDQKYTISITKFNTSITPLITDISASEVNELTEKDYKPDQSTALHDAIGISVTELEKKLESKPTTTTVVVILTDGEENASKIYNSSKVKEMIDKLNKTGLWTFSFVGANQDSILTSKSYGIDASNVMNYSSDSIGTKKAFARMSSAMTGRAYSMSVGEFSNINYLSNQGDENLKDTKTNLDNLTNDSK